MTGMTSFHAEKFCRLVSAHTVEEDSIFKGTKDLSLLKFLWSAPQNFPISAKVMFWPFKVIRGHWFWRQSKACMWLPISPS